MKLQTSAKYYAVLAAGSFAMTALSFSGIFFLQDDLVGRIATGLAWSIVTCGWLGQYFHACTKGNKHI